MTLAMLRTTTRQLPPRSLTTHHFSRHLSQWHESDITTDRKSRFQARHVPLALAAEIPAILATFLKLHKSASKASHPHIIAWRTATSTGTSTYTNVQQGYHDNGEKGAGIKLLDQVLVRHGVYNVLVIVTRWYGGSPLGGLRFRHIVGVASESLRKGGYLGGK
ncbi:ribosomal protein S5 domain 2-like protein [Suhomyces tanzawaensis NRRL Y-17324]|uniref:Ribosomal protein S5 domain 2-like protein n=1 Tax=Suhomyces tanzawaensis NRRL Y-17324 TaxID=984487 RepID=A0A1E4SB82_9ASCO|nr:ribosomal protein S5 domain 2-like protein [Suhomyces tanzawaensis NRRL Y-17324]ODV76738.1 ribosomal protein S5 domain 2-like protein [Suhomyces tanzawaensis NRRL Y-17324]